MSSNKIIVTFIMGAVAICTGCSGDGTKHARRPTQYIREYKLKDLPRFDVPVEINDRVIAWMEYFQGPGRGHFRRYLERSGRYIPLMRGILKEKGLPGDLVYVALIESGFNNNAYSRSRAVGPWQFIQGTGRRYGLRIDGWVDERRDPVRATYAAAGYLRDLYDEFGDWYLAMAGYNAGEGRIRSVIDAAGSRDFWTIAAHRHALRAETRDYVPKYIAAAIMAKMPERFGFENVEYHSPFEFEIGLIESQTDLGVVAECAGVDSNIIAEFNPHLVRGATPPDTGNYGIRLPKGSAKGFQEKYAAIPKEERIKVVYHRVRRGETLVKIARRYGLSVNQLASANNLKPRSHVRRGRLLVIPTGGVMAKFLDVDRDREPGSVSRQVVVHRVKAGETAGGIAMRYGVSLAKLKSWNGLGRKALVHTGQRLKIYKRVKGQEGVGAEVADTKADKVRYKVRPGETLGRIAVRYGVSVKQLMAWNNISDPRRVRAGMSLSVRGVKKEASPEVKSTATTAIAIAGLERGAESQQESKSSPVEPQTTSQVVGETSATPVPQQIQTPAPVTNSSVLEVGVTPGEPIKLASIAEGGAASTGAPADKSASAPDHRQAGLVYHVKSGDTLWDIARRHKVTISQIQEWNKLRDPSAVRPGTKLKIHR